jgi:lipid-A-disaccharide synthase-like uncharacterized protein
MWELIGYLGNVLFGLRFFTQWIASERAGKSVIPKSFWHLSIAGSIVALIYALHIVGEVGWKKGLPIVLGLAPNVVIYVRNLMLIERHERGSAAALVGTGLREREPELVNGR